MDREQKGDFTRRLSQCNSGELIVIMYDIVFAYMDDAKKAYETNDRETWKAGLRMSDRALDELIQSLDFNYELSGQLYSIYAFCKRKLAEAMYKYSLDELEIAEHLLRKLHGGFVQVAQEDKSAPLMRNTQQVYAGMTYGRGAENENYLEPDSHRGFFV